MYGGRGLDGLYLPQTNYTRPTAVLDEMWQLGLHDCPNHCSYHGDCQYGFCICDQGYYGLDCSNSSCPSDFCYYNEVTMEQVCSHCCQSGWQHSENDTYMTTDILKTSCSLEHPGESHGICDGFGTCQCQPPFIGEDCSIRDCPHNCSFNGYCSVEYPVSRCICNPGYYGEECQYQECLNNCTYPHGECNNQTGLCDCRMIFNPYVNTREWRPWGGEDCSFLPAFAAAPTSFSGAVLCLNLVLSFVVAIAIAMGLAL
ncbi:unnamed protein product [Chrysoparadoxa australica]